MITVDKAVVRLTEQTVKEIVRVIDQVKQNVGFTPEEILVGSEFSGITYLVVLETCPRSQESLGYKILIKDVPVTQLTIGKVNES